MWKIAAIAVFIVEAILSHTPGPASGAESRWLAEKSGVDEGMLRHSAHVILFLALSFCAGMGWQWIGVGIIAVWSIVDEATKPLIPGRHCSAFDMILNLAGTVAGIVVWLVVR